MASKSGGVIPPRETAMEMNQAMAMLEAMHFFSIKKVNRDDTWGYQVKITHAGKRVSAQRRNLTNAIHAAFAKLRGDERGGFKLKLVGANDEVKRG